MSDALNDLLADFRDVEEEAEQDEALLLIDDLNGQSDEVEDMKIDGVDDGAKGDGTAPNNDQVSEMGVNELQTAAAAGKRVGAKFESEEAMHRALSKIDFRKVSDISRLLVVHSSLAPLLEQVKSYLQESTEDDEGSQSFDVTPESALLHTANDKSRAIDDEIFLVTRFIRDHYSWWFPALEKLVPSYVDYAKAVMVIGGTKLSELGGISAKDNPLGKTLDEILDRHTTMTIKMQASMQAITTKVKDFDPVRLAQVQKACAIVVELDDAKALLTEFVRSRMSKFAPNLTALVGHDTAAKLITSAGGLSKLTQIPASNVPSMGAKNVTTGFATNVSVRREGFVYASPFITGLNLNPDYKVKAIRILSAKIILAARCDAARTSRDGSDGKLFLQQVVRTIEKVLKPPKQKGHRVLPKPDEKLSKRRGGKLARRAKAANQQTEMAKLANRMKFNEAEEEVGYGSQTEGLGMLGQQGEGKIRAAKIDSKTRAKVSKKNSNWLNGTATQAGTVTTLRGELNGSGAHAGSATSLRAHGLRTSGFVPGTVAGTAMGTTTSINFDKGRTQGVELADPGALQAAERKRKLLEDKWFAAPAKEPKLDEDGFKVPALPIKKTKNEN